MKIGNEGKDKASIFERSAGVISILGLAGIGGAAGLGYLGSRKKLFENALIQGQSKPKKLRSHDYINKLFQLPDKISGGDNAAQRMMRRTLKSLGRLEEINQGKGSSGVKSYAFKSSDFVKSHVKHSIPNTLQSTLVEQIKNVVYSGPRDSNLFSTLKQAMSDLGRSVGLDPSQMDNILGSLESSKTYAGEMHNAFSTDPSSKSIGKISKSSRNIARELVQSIETGLSSTKFQIEEGTSLTLGEMQKSTQDMFDIDYQSLMTKLETGEITNKQFFDQTMDINNKISLFRRKEEDIFDIIDTFKRNLESEISTGPKIVMIPTGLNKSAREMTESFNDLVGRHKGTKLGSKFKTMKSLVNNIEKITDKWNASAEEIQRVGIFTKKLDSMINDLSSSSTDDFEKKTIEKFGKRINNVSSFYKTINYTKEGLEEVDWTRDFGFAKTKTLMMETLPEISEEVGLLHKTRLAEFVSKGKGKQVDLGDFSIGRLDKMVDKKLISTIKKSVINAPTYVRNFIEVELGGLANNRAQVISLHNKLQVAAPNLTGSIKRLMHQVMGEVKKLDNNQSLSFDLIPGRDRVVLEMNLNGKKVQFPFDLEGGSRRFDMTGQMYNTPNFATLDTSGLKNTGTIMSSTDRLQEKYGTEIKRIIGMLENGDEYQAQNTIRKKRKNIRTHDIMKTSEALGRESIVVITNLEKEHLIPNKTVRVMETRLRKELNILESLKGEWGKSLDPGRQSQLRTQINKSNEQIMGTRLKIKQYDNRGSYMDKQAALMKDIKQILRRTDGGPINLNDVYNGAGSIKFNVGVFTASRTFPLNAKFLTVDSGGMWGYVFGPGLTKKLLMPAFEKYDKGSTSSIFRSILTGVTSPQHKEHFLNSSMPTIGTKEFFRMRKVTGYNPAGAQGTTLHSLTDGSFLDQSIGGGNVITAASHGAKMTGVRGKGLMIKSPEFKITSTMLDEHLSRTNKTDFLELDVDHVIGMDLLENKEVKVRDLTDRSFEGKVRLSLIRKGDDVFVYSDNAVIFTFGSKSTGKVANIPVRDRTFVKNIFDQFATDKGSMSLGKAARELRNSVSEELKKLGSTKRSKFMDIFDELYRKMIGTDRLTMDTMMKRNRYADVFQQMISKLGRDMKALVLARAKDNPSLLRNGRLAPHVKISLEAALNEFASISAGKSGVYVKLLEQSTETGIANKIGTAVSDSSDISMLHRSGKAEGMTGDISDLIYYQNNASKLLDEDWIAKHHDDLKTKINKHLKILDPEIDTWDPLYEVGNMRAKTRAIEISIKEAASKVTEKNLSPENLMDQISDQIGRKYVTGLWQVAKSKNNKMKLTGWMGANYDVHAAQLPTQIHKVTQWVNINKQRPGGISGGNKFDIWKLLSLHHRGLNHMAQRIGDISQLGAREVADYAEIMRPFIMDEGDYLPMKLSNEMKIDSRNFASNITESKRITKMKFGDIHKGDGFKLLMDVVDDEGNIIAGSGKKIFKSAGDYIDFDKFDAMLHGTDIDVSKLDFSDMLSKDALDNLKGMSGKYVTFKKPIEVNWSGKSISVSRLKIPKFGRFNGDGYWNVLQSVVNTKTGKRSTETFSTLSPSLRAYTRLANALSEPEGADKSTNIYHAMTDIFDAANKELLGGKGSALHKKVFAPQVGGTIRATALSGGTLWSELSKGYAEGSFSKQVHGKLKKNPFYGMETFKTNTGAYLTPSVGEVWVSKGDFAEMMKNSGSRNEINQMIDDIRTGKKLKYVQVNRESTMTTENIKTMSLKIFSPGNIDKKILGIEGRKEIAKHIIFNKIDLEQFRGDTDSDSMTITLALQNEQDELFTDSYNSLKVKTRKGDIDFFKSGSVLKWAENVQKAPSTKLSDFKDTYRIVNGEDFIDTITGVSVKDKARGTILKEAFSMTKFRKGMTDILSTSGDQKEANRLLDHLFPESGGGLTDIYEKYIRGDGDMSDLKKATKLIFHKSEVIGLGESTIMKAKLVDSIAESANSLKKRKTDFISEHFIKGDVKNIDEALNMIRKDQIFGGFHHNRMDANAKSHGILLNSKETADILSEDFKLAYDKKHRMSNVEMQKFIAETKDEYLNNFTNEKSMTPVAWKKSRIQWYDTFLKHGNSAQFKAIDYYIGNVQQNSMSSKHAIPLVLEDWANVTDTLFGNNVPRGKSGMTKKEFHNVFSTVANSVKDSKSLNEARKKIEQMNKYGSREVYSLITGDYTTKISDMGRTVVKELQTGGYVESNADKVYLSQYISYVDDKSVRVAKELRELGNRNLEQGAKLKTELLQLNAKKDITTDLINTMRLTSNKKSYGGKSIVNDNAFINEYITPRDLAVNRRYVDTQVDARVQTANKGTAGSLMYDLHHTVGGLEGKSLSRKQIQSLSNIKGVAGNLLSDVFAEAGFGNPAMQSLAASKAARNTTKRVEEKISRSIRDRAFKGKFGSALRHIDKTKRIGGLPFALTALLGGFALTQALHSDPASELGTSPGRGGEYWEHRKRKRDEDKFNPVNTVMDKQTGIINRLLGSMTNSKTARISMNRYRSVYGTNNDIIRRNQTSNKRADIPQFDNIRYSSQNTKAYSRALSLT